MATFLVCIITEKGRTQVAEKLLKVTAEKSVGLISAEAKVDKSAALLSRLKIGR